MALPPPVAVPPDEPAPAPVEPLREPPLPALGAVACCPGRGAGTFGVETAAGGRDDGGAGGRTGGFGGGGSGETCGNFGSETGGGGGSGGSGGGWTSARASIVVSATAALVRNAARDKRAACRTVEGLTVFSTQGRPE